LTVARNHLNEQGIDTLHFKSSKTDLPSALPDQARFTVEQIQCRTAFNSLQTFPPRRFFTTPTDMRADGYVTTTKPVYVLDVKTEDVRFVFQGRKNRRIQRPRRKEALDTFFSIDEGQAPG
jgi:aminopeptidase